MNFERHQDPLTSMRIGVTTWNKLQPGHVLRTKNAVRLTAIPGGAFKLKGDGSKLDNTIMKDMYCYLVRVEHLSVKDGKTKIIQLVFSEYWDIRTIGNDKVFKSAKTLTGNVDRLQNKFEIIQRTRI
jgi:hypothetical protein